MTMLSGGDHGRYVEQVHDDYYSTLRYYFLKHLDEAFADACVRETFHRFFDSMKDGSGGREHAYTRACLMRIAFAVCAEREARGESARASLRRASPSGLGLFPASLGNDVDSRR